MEFRVFRVYDHNKAFVVIFANIKMNIKMYWPKTHTLEQKINKFYRRKLKKYILFTYCQCI